MTGKRHFTLILILGSLTALGPFSIDMYLPGFPAIAKDLNATTAEVGLSLSAFFIGISAGQLLYGPLLDRFGRKKPLYIGLIVYFVSSLACSFIHSVEGLVLLRFIQAVGSCAAAVASVAMVRDFFLVKDSAKIFSTLMLVVALSPMLAPTIGGYVTAAFGWQSVFVILALMSAGMFCAVLFLLPESSKPDPSYSLKPKPIVKNFLTVIKNPQFSTYITMGAISFSGLLVYVAGSPTVFMEIYKLDERVYGWIFAFLSAGFLIASQINRLLLKKFRSEQLIVCALVAQSIAGLIMITGIISGWAGLWAIVILIFFYLASVGFILPNSSALSMAPFSKNAGSASSLMGAVQMGAGSVATILLSFINDGTALPMVAVMTGAAILALIVLLIGRTRIPETDHAVIAN